jgi:hypothetical protein
MKLSAIKRSSIIKVFFGRDEIVALVNSEKFSAHAFLIPQWASSDKILNKGNNSFINSLEEIFFPIAVITSTKSFLLMGFEIVLRCVMIDFQMLFYLASSQIIFRKFSQ